MGLHKIVSNRIESVTIKVEKTKVKTEKPDKAPSSSGPTFNGPVETVNIIYYDKPIPETSSVGTQTEEERNPRPSKRQKKQK